MIAKIFNCLDGLRLINIYSPGYGEDKYLHKITFKIVLQESGAYSLAKLTKAARETGCSIHLTSEAEGRNIKTNAKHLMFHLYLNKNEDIESIEEKIQND